MFGSVLLARQHFRIQYQAQLADKPSVQRMCVFRALSDSDSNLCRTPFRFLSDRVPGGCRTVFGPDWNGVRQD
jgi:hypothetical protein